MAVLPVRVREVDVQLVDARGVVHVGHDLVLADPGVVLDGLEGLLQEGPEHGRVVAAQVAEGPDLPVLRDGEPVEHPFRDPLVRAGQDQAVVARRQRAAVPVHPLRVGQKHKVAVAVDDVLLLLRAVDDVADPLLAGAAHLLLDEAGDAGAGVHLRRLGQQGVVGLGTHVL